MQLNLTTWQRVMLRDVVGLTRGNVRTVRDALRALEVLDLDEAERAAVGYRDLGGGRAEWDAESDEKFVLVVPDDGALAVMRQAARAYESWPVAMAEQVLDLMEQLKEDGE